MESNASDCANAFGRRLLPVVLSLIWILCVHSEQEIHYLPCVKYLASDVAECWWRSSGRPARWTRFRAPSPVWNVGGRSLRLVITLSAPKLKPHQLALFGVFVVVFTPLAIHLEETGASKTCHMTHVDRAIKPCHTCRRQRLKCDRTLPHCSKCITKGQQCLGYQALFRWEKGIASRGKMAGKTFGRKTKSRIRDETSSSQSPSTNSLSSRRSSVSNIVVVLPLNPLTDPLYQDLDITSRKYLSYCGSISS